MQKSIKESQIRMMVKTLLEDKTLGPAMIKVNPVVDQSAAITDPHNAEFKPQTKPEMKVALSAMVDDMPDDNISIAFDSIKDALTAKEDEEGKKQMSKSNAHIEESIRLMIRQMLNEIGPIREHFEKDPATGELVWKGTGPAPTLAKKAKMKVVEPGVTGMSVGPKTPEVTDLRRRLKTMDKRPKGSTAKVRSRKNQTVTDVEGVGQQHIANATGMSVANVNKILNMQPKSINAITKMRYAKSMSDEDFDVLFLTSVKDYIDMLSRSPDVTPADVQLLQAHPEIVGDLPGFREYFDDLLKTQIKEKGFK